MMRRKPISRKDAKIHRTFARWHWGVEPGAEVHFDDPDYPDHLVEIGRLMEIHVDDGRGDRVIAVPDALVPETYLAFDVDCPQQRMVVIAHPSTFRSLARRIPRMGDPRYYPLADVAEATGGHHQGHYPDIEARPLGTLTHIVYFTHKKGDGPSGYIHEMGEMGGVRPMACVDRKGRLWFAGGDYTCPTPGITN